MVKKRKRPGRFKGGGAFLLARMRLIQATPIVLGLLKTEAARLSSPNFSIPHHEKGNEGENEKNHDARFISRYY